MPKTEPTAPPAYAVRFESYDDFLVEYSDHLRAGYLVLPIAGLEPSAAVRLKVHLPDQTILFLTGTTVLRSASKFANADDTFTGTLVKLSALGKEQQEAVERCLQRIVGREGPTASDLEGQPINVLLVDDSVTVRIELGDAMRARGMRVRVADNGLAALSAALKRVPDVILTDVEMPVMDGWTLLRTVRKRAKLANVPVVFLTALSDELSRLQGYRLGVDDYLSKDTRPEEVMARLRGALLRRARAPEDRPGAQGLRGDLEHVRLGSVLAFLESERRTGMLRIKKGSDEAVMHVCRGYLEYVENLGRFAHVTDRVFDLLEWNHGEFEFFNRDGSNESPSDEATPLSYLLMEHARRVDEANAG